ncbi:MAG: glycosyltransferase family 4 protein [Acidobacteria bacterium]|nr:glycosyltransferase family 4 protein [Acidobacteriota bacterium]
MRIAIDCRKFDDYGIGTTIRGIVNGLASLSPGDLECLILGPATLLNRLPDSPQFRHVEEISPHYSIRELFSLGRTAERHGADLIHVPHYVTPFTRLPLVTTIHDLIHLRAPRKDLPLGGRLYAQWMLGRSVKKSARVVTVTNSMKREIEQQFPHVGRDRIVLVSNGVPASELDTVPVETREPFILFVGNDKPHKNVDRLVRAFSRVRQGFPHVSLVLAGSPFERFRTTAGVALRGFVSEAELIRLYRSATLLVQPSLMEGFGLPVAEAMSHGTPVVVSAISPLLEVAGDAGIAISDPLDVDAIEYSLATALGDEQLRRRSASLGLQIAARYRWSDAARSLVNLWKDVLSGA